MLSCQAGFSARFDRIGGPMLSLKVWIGRGFCVFSGSYSGLPSSY